MKTKRTDASSQTAARSAGVAEEPVSSTASPPLVDDTPITAEQAWTCCATRGRVGATKTTLAGAGNQRAKFDITIEATIVFPRPVGRQTSVLWSRAVAAIDAW